MFTYASPATFDFNGDWQGWAGNVARRTWGASRVDHSGQHGRQRLVRCAAGELFRASSLTLDPPPVVANGEFSFGGSGGVIITGKILSPIYAVGSLNTASCGSRYWCGREKVWLLFIKQSVFGTFVCFSTRTPRTPQCRHEAEGPKAPVARHRFSTI